ncbi:MAG: carbon-nitrogen hydrolase family protein [Candidatus Latescibacterota bacterium]|nr:carbon-nitrogen hydrolase family protein [Candidatus Latescibacterota bacterium]
MYRSCKVAAISMKPTKWGKAANADRLEELISQAAREQTELVVSTEGVLEGYVVMDVVAHPNKVEMMLDIAEPIDGPYIQRFQRLAKILRICLCFGFAERIKREVFNSAVFIDRAGQICGKYHKTQLAEGTCTSWTFNRIGRRLRAFDTPLGRAGIVICNDRWNPDITRALVLDGAQMILIPSYGSKSKSQNEAVLARARENGVPIVEANVGVNLIISKGEVVAYAWGNDQITMGTIDIPEPPSTTVARRAEREYLKAQGPEMRRRYRKTMKELRA